MINKIKNKDIGNFRKLTEQNGRGQLVHMALMANTLKVQFIGFWRKL
jgi:hypothetical protein